MRFATLIVIAVIAILAAAAVLATYNTRRPPQSLPRPTVSATPAATNLDDPHLKDIALQLIASAEVSTQDYRSKYGYIEDIGDDRGYTGGFIGFCSGTGDMLGLIRYYTKLSPTNPLAKYIPALEAIDALPGDTHPNHDGLDPDKPYLAGSEHLPANQRPKTQGPNLVRDWQLAAKDPLFRQAFDHEMDRLYFDPAVAQAKADGLHALGQFIYFDAAVMHGFDDSLGIRKTALQTTKLPAQGGDEVAYLNAYLNARVALMRTEAAHDDVSRVETEQRVFLKSRNLNLRPPLQWQTYQDHYVIN